MTISDVVADIVPGQVVQVTDHVWRITASNAGVMTGSGTNTYLVGESEIAVIDPGPAIQSHIDAILDFCGDKIRWILATHTHSDHSPAAAILASATGATVLGNVLEHNDGYQDDSFQPIRGFVHDECLVVKELTIRALYTPGHVDNHLCYLVENDGLLLTGDHIMQGSTVVIIPPYGDMKKYIHSLTLLLDYPIKALGPGHGHLINTPKQEIEGIIKHRLAREKKVITVLKSQPKISLNKLTLAVYDDVDAALHTIACHSLFAHLLKLEQEQQAGRDGDNWFLL